ncbi:MAG: ParB/RepB/Spo0J family partition protein, partial [Pseudomonadota bacterium]
ELDPMKVWWSGARWIVLDGHHRLEAYRVAAARERTPPESYAVPVRAFEGTPEEAYEEAPQENAKVRNPISSAERQEWAWRTLVSGVETSPTKISEAAGVSRQQVYNMKKKLAELRGAGREPAELEELGWWRCRSLDVERSDAPVDEEAMDAFHAHREEVIDRLFRALDREFGGKWHKMADFFAHGLAERAPKFAHMLVDSEAFWPLVQEVHAAELREEHEEEAMAVELQRLNGPKRDDLPF